MRRRFWLKVFGMTLSLMLALCQPMMAYALEGIEDTGAPAPEQVLVLEVVVQEDISSDEPVEGSEVVVSEEADYDNPIEEVPDVPEGQNQLENIVSDESNPEDEITAGVGNSSEENVTAETLAFPYAHISEEGDDVVDAEKYSLYVEGYDRLLCWAGTASNMLWMAGYAQNAINPLTGETFKSEDEVFDYYRTCFTDEGSLEAAGIVYFISGKYSEQGIMDASQLKDDAPPGGFFPTLDVDRVMVDVQQDPEGCADVLELYDSLQADECKGSAGLGIYFWKIADEKIYGGHAITLLSIEKDEDGKYLGIWIVDSDDSTPYSSGLTGDTPEERAALAANAPNIRQYYTISYEEIDGEYIWMINDYVPSEYKTLILTLTYLMQYDPDWFKTSGGGTPSSSVGTEAYDAIKDMMIEEGWAVFSPTGGIYDSANDTGYSMFVCRLANDLLNVYVDGNRLSFGSGEYKIYRSNNGIFTITFGTEVMQNLEAGEHTITLDFGNGEDVETTVTVK